jgi:hypothetical protein
VGTSKNKTLEENDFEIIPPALMEFTPYNRRDRPENSKKKKL